MSLSTRKIHNPITGETMVFRKTSAETGGELLEFDMYVEPGGYPTTEHVHPSQTEHFELKSGSFRLRKHGEEGSYQAGDQVVVPPGTPHLWRNVGDEEVHAVVQLRPADRFEYFLTSLFALAQDGKTNDKGMPNPLQLAVMMKEYGHVVRPSRPPRPVQKIIFFILAPLGRLLGYRADHPYPDHLQSSN